MTHYTPEEWDRAVARRNAMRAWLVDADAHAAMCRALCKELDVPDWLMARVYARRRWYLIPDVAYWSVEEYIDASRAAFAADGGGVRVEISDVARPAGRHQGRGQQNKGNREQVELGHARHHTSLRARARGHRAWRTTRRRPVWRARR